MRNRADRIRHAISFELIGLALVTPLGALVFGMPLGDTGVVTVVSATVAMGWNYLYNLLFDHALLRLNGHTRKTLPVRVFHALLFEAGMLAALMPFIAWYLQIGLWLALVMDGSFSAFYVVYAFLFNWAYDWIFPVPAPHLPPDARSR